MSEQETTITEHQEDDELLDQVLTAMELAIGHKYVGYYPEKSITRIKRTEPDNSVLLDLYINNPKARELIDTFVNSAPKELALKLGLPQEQKH